MRKGLVCIPGVIFLFVLGARGGEPALVLQSVQTLTDPGAFLLIGFGLLAIGAIGVRRYKE